jgi:hypothetical protein
MTTLAEYAHQHYPNHRVDATDGPVPLAGHTTVAHVIGRDRGRTMVDALKQRIEPERVTSIVVRPTDPSVVNSGGEDPEGIADLPYRRVAAGAVVGGVVIGAAVGVVAGLIFGNLIAGLVLGVFGAVIGGVIGGVASGGGRFGGHRAWEQQHAPDSSVVLVAVLLDEESRATEVATYMAAYEPEDVRILNTDGAWHSPHN